MPMTDTAANPLLTSSPLPLFDAIRPEHVSPALDVLLADANAALETAVAADTPADYDTLSRTLTVATEAECVEELKFDGEAIDADFLLARVVEHIQAAIG